MPKDTAVENNSKHIVYIIFRGERYGWGGGHNWGGGSLNRGRPNGLAQSAPPPPDSMG